MLTICPPLPPLRALAGLAVLSLVACDDARMSVLNAQHRGKEGPTDVLSFEMDDGLDYKVRPVQGGRMFAPVWTPHLL